MCNLFMIRNRFKEYIPPNILQNYIDTICFFRNNTDGEINFPFVPYGSSDII